MKFVSTLFCAVLATIPVSVLSDSIEIVDWDVSDFEVIEIDDDTNTTSIDYKANVYAGETVTWTYDASGGDTLVSFKSGEDYEICNMTAATEVDATGTYSLLAWPLKKIKRERIPKWYASASDCEGGAKIMLKFKPKQFEGSSSNTCEVPDGTTETVVSARGKGKCARECKKKQDCFGYQFVFDRSSRPFTRSCTLYDDYPSPTGEVPPSVHPKKPSKAFCFSVKYNNTLGED